MYKYYDENGYKVMHYDFGSITEFINYLNSHETNTDAFRGRLASQDDDYDFCKTRSLNEAEELCKFGYHEDFDKLVELKVKLEKYIKMSKKRTQQYNYYVGFAPDVKAYLEGNPLSMLNKQNPKRKHVDIYYNSANLAHVSTSQIFNRGAVTLSIVEILENMGFSVGLHVFTMSGCGDQIHYAKFNLKHSGERLNMKKLYFPLCHPSFFRRLVFRLKEQTPDINHSWSVEYGRTSNDNTIRKILKLKPNDIVICRAEEMNVKGNDILEDANNMFKYIDQDDQQRDFELGKILEK